MQTAFIDGHFILSRSLREGLCYRRSSDGLLITINNIYLKKKEAGAKINLLTEKIII